MRGDPVVYTDQWGRAHWKLSPRGFCTFSTRATAPERCMYVADNPAKDIRRRGARDGVPCGASPQGEHARADAASPLDQADCTVTGLGEVSVADLLVVRRSDR